MLNCALIGYGYWGPNIARSIQKLENVQLVAICDFDTTKLKQARLQYPQSSFTSNADEIINNSKIDAIIVATPASTHFQLASKALEHNKHLLIEKPITSHLDEVLMLQKINSKMKKTVMVGHTFEYNPAILKIKDTISNNELGNIYYIYSTRVNLGQIRGDINALWNLAPHDISIFNYLLDSEPIKVMAVGSSFLQKNIEDVVFATLQYPHGIMAEIHLSWLDPAKKKGTNYSWV